MIINYSVRKWQNGSGWSCTSELDTTGEVGSFEEFRDISVDDLFGWFLEGCSAEYIESCADDSDGDELLVADIRDEDGDVVSYRKIWVSELAAARIKECGK